MSSQTAIERIVSHMENDQLNSQLEWNHLKEAMSMLMKEQLYDAFQAGSKFGHLMAVDAANPKAINWNKYYNQNYKAE